MDEVVLGGARDRLMVQLTQGEPAYLATKSSTGSWPEPPILKIYWPSGTVVWSGVAAVDAEGVATWEISQAQVDQMYEVPRAFMARMFVAGDQVAVGPVEWSGSWFRTIASLALSSVQTVGSIRDNDSDAAADRAEAARDEAQEILATVDDTVSAVTASLAGKADAAALTATSSALAKADRTLGKGVALAYQQDLRRLRLDTSDFTSLSSGLAIGHADVQAVAGANGEFFSMPSTVDAPIPSNCPVDFGGALQRVWISGYSATQRPMGFMVNTWRFMCDDDLVVLYCGGPGAAQVFVDGALAGEFDTAFVVNTWTSLRFPSKKPRLIEIRTSQSFGTIYWRKNRRVWKPKPVGGPRLLAVGDSMFQPFITTDGTATSDKPFRGWWQQIGPHLGIRDVMVDGVGSTGFIKESTAGAANNFNQRFALNHAPFSPDILVTAGGTNDVYNGNTNAEIVAAMKTYFLAARAAWPDAKLVMMGGIKPATGWPSDALTRYSAIASTLLADTAVQAAGLYVVDTWTDPWIFGTGKDTVTNGTGNSDFYTGNDAVHLNVSGNRYMASRSAERLRRILKDRGELLNTIV